MNKEYPYMRQATASWLVSNTSLTMEQIACFCGMLEIEVEMMDEEAEENPVANGQLKAEMIKVCEENPSKPLELYKTAGRLIEPKNRKARYVPRTKRGNKPDAILFMLRSCPSITNKQIIKLISTTNPVVDAVKNKNHWNYVNIEPKDPVLLGLCTQSQLDKLVKEIELQDNADSHKKEVVVTE